MLGVPTSAVQWSVPYDERPTNVKIETILYPCKPFAVLCSAVYKCSLLCSAVHCRHYKCQEHQEKCLCKNCLGLSKFVALNMRCLVVNDLFFVAFLRVFIVCNVPGNEGQK